MRFIVPALAAGSLLISATAYAAPKCNVAGTWTDSYGVSATFNKKGGGIAHAPSVVCAVPYKIKSTTLTTTTWDLSATAKKCPSVSAALTFASGSCTSASGTVTFSTTTLSDTWTKTAAGTRRTPPVSPLSSGLR